MNTDRLLSVAEVADLLGLKRPTVYKKVCRREIPFIKPGGPRGRVLFRPEDLEAFIASRRVPSYEEAAKRRRPQGQPRGLDLESATSLVVGSLGEDAGALATFSALLQTAQELGPEGLRQATTAALEQTPPEQRPEAVRRIGVAGEQLAALLRLTRPEAAGQAAGEPAEADSAGRQGRV